MDGAFTGIEIRTIIKHGGGGTLDFFLMINCFLQFFKQFFLSFSRSSMWIEFRKLFNVSSVKLFAYFAQFNKSYFSSE